MKTMNLKKRNSADVGGSSKGKLNIFSSFSGTKSGLYFTRQDTSRQSSTPVLLGVRQRTDEETSPSKSSKKISGLPEQSSTIQKLRRQRSAATFLEKFAKEVRHKPTRSVSICYQPTNSFTLPPKFKLPSFTSLPPTCKRNVTENEVDNLKNDNTANIHAELEEIDRFEKQFVEPLSARVRESYLDEEEEASSGVESSKELSTCNEPSHLPSTPDSLHRLHSSTGSVVSDSNYDSGAFSRTSTPEPLDRLSKVMPLRVVKSVSALNNINKENVEPLKSPPLVLSISKSSDIVNSMIGNCNEDVVDGKTVLSCLTAAGQSSNFDSSLKGQGPECTQRICTQTKQAKQFKKLEDNNIAEKVEISQPIQFVTSTENKKIPFSKNNTAKKPNPCAVTVTIGASTKISVNNSINNGSFNVLTRLLNEELNDPNQCQSLPNLIGNKNPIHHIPHDIGRARSKMPHMGTARLVTPPKPPRLTTPTRSIERNKISTVVLNNNNSTSTPLARSSSSHTSSKAASRIRTSFDTSFTAVSSKGRGSSFHVKKSNPFREEILRMQPITKDILARSGRGSSSSSDGSSGVHSGSCSDSCSWSQVTVNGQHLHCDRESEKYERPINCDDTLSTCSECEQGSLILHL